MQETCERGVQLRSHASFVHRQARELKQIGAPMLMAHMISSDRVRTLVLRFLVATLEVLPPAGQILLVLDRLGMHRLRRRRSRTACASWSRRRTARGHAWRWFGRYCDAGLLHVRRPRRE